MHAREEMTSAARDNELDHRHREEVLSEVHVNHLVQVPLPVKMQGNAPSHSTCMPVQCITFSLCQLSLESAFPVTSQSHHQIDLGGCADHTT